MIEPRAGTTRSSPRPNPLSTPHISLNHRNHSEIVIAARCSEYSYMVKLPSKALTTNDRQSAQCALFYPAVLIDCALV